MSLEARKLEVEYPKRATMSPVVIENWWIRSLAVTIFVSLIILMGLVNFRADKTLEYFTNIFGILGFAYMMFKVVLSFFYKPAKDEPNKNHKVSVIMPSYNENPESVKKSIEGLLQQDYPIYEIIFVDDGSEDDTAYKEIKKLAREINESYLQASSAKEYSYSESGSPNIPKIIAHKFKKNRGKKIALAWGFKKSKGDVLLCVDTDGYVYPNALREILKPFNDERVTSVVGHISARNLKKNFLTRLQDIFYYNSFRMSRGAQSVTNSVLVCSGALSIHRRKFVVDHIKEFLKPTVMGIPSKNCDDICLTYISLKYGGKTKYQSTAQCITDVPIKSGQFFKQQVRWAKSFFLYTFETLKIAWKKPNILMWVLGEGFLWIIFGISKAFLLLHWSGDYFLVLSLYVIGYFILSTLVSGLYYVFRNPLVYIFAPVYALAHILVLIPIRLYALLTINKTKWGTR